MKNVVRKKRMPVIIIRIVVILFTGFRIYFRYDYKYCVFASQYLKWLYSLIFAGKRRRWAQTRARMLPRRVAVTLKRRCAAAQPSRQDTAAPRGRHVGTPPRQVAVTPESAPAGISGSPRTPAGTRRRPPPPAGCPGTAPARGSGSRPPAWPHTPEPFS